MNTRQRIFTLFFLACTLMVQAKTYLVCVGIADYPGTGKDLRVSNTDALTIENIFVKNGQVQASSLTDSRASIQNVCNEMKTAFAQASPNDNIILYFSGHGFPGGFYCYDGPLYYKTVFDIMKQSRAKNKIIMADACFSGKMRTSKRSAQSYSNENVMLFLSSRSNEKSQETLYKNSLFTIFLERGLRGGADVNKDRSITARELYDFVHQGVTEASSGRQNPVMWGKFDNNMTIIQW